tara:strand:- start:365 stop:733 length:369 start_codon:yes stop_codon:yes gene_type:complete
MNLELNNNLSFKNNLKKIIDHMIPGDKHMPRFTKAVDIEIILEKFKKKQNKINLKKINLENKKHLKIITNILGNEIVETYFTSNLVIKALKKRRKIFLEKKKKESIFYLLKKVKDTKLKFIK